MMLSIIIPGPLDRAALRRRPRPSRLTYSNGRPLADRLRPADRDRARSPTRSSTTSRPAFYFVVATTGIILILAANTAFNGFPVLASILAKDGFLPRQLHTRGDRLAFSNGILILAGCRDAPDHRLQRRVDAPDPALHRRRLRLLHPQPARHDPALDPAPARPRPTRRTRARCSARGSSTRIGLAMTAIGVRRRADHQVPGRRVDRDPGDGRSSSRSCAPSATTTTGSRRSWSSARATRSCRPGCTRSCWSPSCTSRPCGRSPTPRPPAPTCSRRSSSTSTGGRPASWSTSGTRSASTYPLKMLYSPYREIIRPIVQYVRRDPRGQPARRRGGLHPGVRRRPLVGADAAQPDRPAAQGPAAVHPGRDGHLRALPAAWLRAREGPWTTEELQTAASRRRAPRPART